MTVVPKHVPTHLGSVHVQLSLHTCAVRVYKTAYIPFLVDPNPLVCKTWLYCAVCSAQIDCKSVSHGALPWLHKS